MQIEGADFLLTIAEVSLAFVGFSAVVAAFRRRQDESWSPYQRLVVRFMVELGFGALFLSLLPFLLFHLETPGDWLWRIANLALAGFLLGYGTHYLIRRRRVGVPVDGPVTPRRMLWMGAVNYFLGGAALLAGFGVVPAGLGVYSLGLVCLLLLGASTFTLNLTIADS